MPDQRRKADTLSEKEIKKASTIEAEDVATARKWWRSHAPAQFKELLDAEEQKPTAD